MSARLEAILDERHNAARNAYRTRNLEAYRDLFAAGLDYRQADGRAIDRSRLMRNVAAQFSRLNRCHTDFIREALEFDGVIAEETLTQTAWLEASAFGVIRRTWHIWRRGRYTWQLLNGGWKIIRVHVLNETLKSDWSVRMPFASEANPNTPHNLDISGPA
jgi:hypothetical protein